MVETDPAQEGTGRETPLVMGGKADDHEWVRYIKWRNIWSKRGNSHTQRKGTAQNKRGRNENRAHIIVGTTHKITPKTLQTKKTRKKKGGGMGRVRWTLWACEQRLDLRSGKGGDNDKTRNTQQSTQEKMVTNTNGLRTREKEKEKTVQGVERKQPNHTHGSKGGQRWGEKVQKTAMERKGRGKGNRTRQTREGGTKRRPGNDRRGKKPWLDWGGGRARNEEKKGKREEESVVAQKGKIITETLRRGQ